MKNYGKYKYFKSGSLVRRDKLYVFILAVDKNDYYTFVENPMLGVYTASKRYFKGFEEVDGD